MVLQCLQFSAHVLDLGASVLALAVVLLLAGDVDQPYARPSREGLNAGVYWSGATVFQAADVVVEDVADQLADLGEHAVLRAQCRLARRALQVLCEVVEQRLLVGLFALLWGAAQRSDRGAQLAGLL